MMKITNIYNILHIAHINIFRYYQASIPYSRIQSHTFIYDHKHIEFDIQFIYYPRMFRRYKKMPKDLSFMSEISH